MPVIFHRSVFGRLFILAVLLAYNLVSTGCRSTPSSQPATADTANRSVKATEKGLASYYSRSFDGKETASGKIFDSDELIAAHPSFPLGTVVRLTNLENSKSVQLKILDRGPSQENQNENVVIDISRAAAKQLGMLKDGRVPVTVEVLQWGNNERE